MNFDQFYLGMAEYVSTKSKDKGRKVGCVIVGPKFNEVRSIGWNGFPRGVNDEVSSRYERPAKYLWTEHAERNAIYNATLIGISVHGCTIYTNLYPCIDCARAIVQSGIKRIVTHKPDFDDPQWGEGFKVVSVLFNETNVKGTYL